MERANAVISAILFDIVSGVVVCAGVGLSADVVGRAATTLHDAIPLYVCV